MGEQIAATWSLNRLWKSLMDMPSLALALNKMWSKNSDLGTVHVPPPIPDIPASLCLLFAKEKVKLGVPSSVY